MADSRSAHLRKSLDAFIPRSEPETRFREHMLQLLERGSSAFHRDHYVPGHFTASAFVLDPLGSRLLLIHHRKLARWLQPGGHIEPGDADVVAAAQREAREEAGLGDLETVSAGLFDLDIHEIPALGATPAHLHFDVRVLLRAESELLAPSDEVTAARWVALTELGRETTDPSVLRAAKKLA